MWTEAVVPGFLIGIASSAHCAGMCGAFALRAGTGGARAPWRMLLYLSGKAFTYVFLGALAGLAGASIIDQFVGIQGWLGLAVGAVLLFAGVRLLRPPGAIRATGPGAWIGRVFAPVFQFAHSAEAAGGPFALGAVTGLLPCGIVYVAAIQGAGLGTPLGGAALMAAFGAGTVPILAAVGLLGHGAVARFGASRLRITGGVLLLAAGCVGVYRALIPLLADPAAGGPPCCH
jgi:sulfite exporter TauE/SafE